MDSTIVDLRAQPLDLPLSEPFRIATGTQETANNVLVRLVLADGTEGLGEAAPVAHISGESQQDVLLAVERARRLLLGRDVRAWRSLAEDLRQSSAEPVAARAALEMAILDGLTRHLCLPLRLLFGGGAATLRTDMTITAGDVAHAAQSAIDIVRRGIHTAKVKIGAATVDEDLARLVAIHAAAPQLKLIVDANGGHTLESATAFWEGLAQCQLTVGLYEQPLSREDHAGWRELARRFPKAPLCADESARSADDVLALIAEHTVKAINIKLMKSGIVESWAIWQLARAAGLGLMIGGMVESILAMSASAHFAAGLGGFTFVDLDTPLFIRSHPFRGGFRQEGDQISVTDIPCGHGVSF